ncbi:hypothetical protein TcasGA2_TC001218 [Tribolium castaneum]|uniref:Uncharacterized protein n=1 Tax=Tribolium castaneum TaxID=7070 RepID=D6WAU1_TRICA|nr:hypothetical protein TcasGA2_TC001218 [Tribolium castaneum]
MARQQFPYWILSVRALILGKCTHGDGHIECNNYEGSWFWLSGLANNRADVNSSADARQEILPWTIFRETHAGHGQIYPDLVIGERTHQQIPYYPFYRFSTLTWPRLTSFRFLSAITMQITMNIDVRVRGHRTLHRETSDCWEICAKINGFLIGAYCAPASFPELSKSRFRLIRTKLTTTRKKCAIDDAAHGDNFRRLSLVKSGM